MTMPETTPPARPHPARSVLTTIANVVRGMLMGIAELLPGISGGTIALITGIYERLIDSAAAVVAAVKALVRGPDRRAGFAREMRRVQWALLIPVVAGMALMILTLAGPIEQVVSENIELARGLFFGLVAASIIVPLQMIRPTAVSSAVGSGARIAGVVVFIVAAAVAFTLTSLAASAMVAQPPLWVVGLAAAVAVCALVIPGVSGSFFLLAIGLYSPTLIAVDERDLGYIAVFATGALIGLVTIVRVMKWMLDHHRRITLIAMAGLMLGSLRALWPWQVTSEGDSHGVGRLAAPYDPVLGPILLALIGAAVVLVLIRIEHVLQRRADERMPRSARPQNEPT